MIEINLLPVDEEAEAKKAAKKGLGFDVPKFIPRGFAIAVTVLLATYLLSHMRAVSLENTLADSEQSLKKLVDARDRAERIEAELGDPPRSGVTIATATSETQQPKDSGEEARKRAAVFKTPLDTQKMWWDIVEEAVKATAETGSTEETGMTEGTDKREKYAQEKLKKLRQRAAIFHTRVDNRKVSSEIVQEIAGWCPNGIRLKKINLDVTGRLEIAGSYKTAVTNPVEIHNELAGLVEMLQNNKTIAAHYKNISLGEDIPEPVGGETPFSIKGEEK